MRSNGTRACLRNCVGTWRRCSRGWRRKTAGKRWTRPWRSSPGWSRRSRASRPGTSSPCWRNRARTSRPWARPTAKPRARFLPARTRTSPPSSTAIRTCSRRWRRCSRPGTTSGKRGWSETRSDCSDCCSGTGERHMLQIIIQGIQNQNSKNEIIMDAKMGITDDLPRGIAADGRLVEVGNGVLPVPVAEAVATVVLVPVAVADVHADVAPPFSTLHASPHHPSAVCAHTYPCSPSSAGIGSPGASLVHVPSAYQEHIVAFGPWHWTPSLLGVSRARTAWALSGQLVTQVQGAGVGVAVALAVAVVPVGVGGAVVVVKHSVGEVWFSRTTSAPTLHHPAAVWLHLTPPVSSL